MNCASASRASIYQRVHNYQWCWNSTSNLCSDEEQAKWTKYTDVENEIIEDAYSEKKNSAEIDGNYIINLEQCIQQKANSDEQCPIKRFQLDSNQSNFTPREERFSSPVPIIFSTSSRTLSDDNDDDWCNAAFDKYATKIEQQNTLIADIVEKAAQGILKEGMAIGKTKEAEWLVQRLSEVKNHGENVKARWTIPIPTEIGKTCVYLYTLNSFWYQLLNQILREPGRITEEKVKTCGPFAYLLRRYLVDNRSKNNSKVYRGVNLTDEQRQEFMKDPVRFVAFTSTSIDQELAEKFGNTLLVFNLNFELAYGITMNAAVGADIAGLSHFPREKEYLIYPGTRFHFVRHEYDSGKKKHVIHLRSWFDK